MQNILFRDDRAIGIDAFAAEVKAVYEALVQPAEDGRGFAQSLYSYVNGLFARIDLLSAYWRGTELDPPTRMVGFMNEYLPYEPEAHNVAVQLWRHQAMPTPEPRGLYDSSRGKSYLWVIYWGAQLPPEQHFRFHEATDSRILSLGLMPLIDDAAHMIARYTHDLASSPVLQDNYQAMETRTSFHKYQPLF